MPVESRAAEFYQGDRGAEYHATRAEVRSPLEQSGRALFFEAFTSPGDTVLDFGCGNGLLASQLPAARRIGVEISEVAGAQARRSLDQVFTDLADVPDHSIDKVISFHALEHVERPVDTLRDMRRVLRPGGRLCLIVPLESVLLQKQHRSWRAEDPDMHLSSWTPLTLGNMLQVAGFQVDSTKMAPFSSGGRLARMARRAPQLARAITWAKALRAKRLQIKACATAPG